MLMICQYGKPPPAPTNAHAHTKSPHKRNTTTQNHKLHTDTISGVISRPVEVIGSKARTEFFIFLISGFRSPKGLFSKSWKQVTTVQNSSDCSELQILRSLCRSPNTYSVRSGIPNHQCDRPFGSRTLERHATKRWKVPRPVSSKTDRCIDGEQQMEKSRTINKSLGNFARNGGWHSSRVPHTPPSSPTDCVGDEVKAHFRDGKPSCLLISSRDWANYSFGLESPRRPAKNVVERFSESRIGQKTSQKELKHELLLPVEEVYGGSLSKCLDSNVAQTSYSSDEHYEPVKESHWEDYTYFQNPLFGDYCEDFISKEGEEEVVIDLQRRSKEADERFMLLSKELKQESFLKNSDFDVPSLVQTIRTFAEERVRLALEVSSCLHSRIADRDFFKEKHRFAKAELESQTRRVENEKNDLQSALERELDRRSSDWSNFGSPAGWSPPKVQHTSPSSPTDCIGDEVKAHFRDAKSSRLCFSSGDLADYGFGHESPQRLAKNVLEKFSQAGIAQETSEKELEHEMSVTLEEVYGGSLSKCLGSNPDTVAQTSYSLDEPYEPIKKYCGEDHPYFQKPLLGDYCEDFNSKESVLKKKSYSILRKKLQELEIQLNAIFSLTELDHDHDHDQTSHLSDVFLQRMAFFKSLLSAEIASHPPKPHNLEHMSQRLDELENAFYDWAGFGNSSILHHIDGASTCSCTESCLNDNGEVSDAVAPHSPVYEGPPETVLDDDGGLAMVEHHDSEEGFGDDEDTALFGDVEFSESSAKEKGDYHCHLEVENDNYTTDQTEERVYDHHVEKGSDGWMLVGAMASRMVLGTAMMGFVMAVFSDCFEYGSEQYFDNFLTPT